MSPTANGLCHSKDCRVTVDPHCWPAAQEQGRGIAGPSLLPQGRREADCMGHAPFSRGLHSKRLILSRKGEVHDLFGMGMGNFWNPESGFPCASRGREIVWGPRRGFQVPGLRAGFGLGHSNRTLHSGLSDFMPEGGKQSTAWPRETPLTTVKGARQSGSN